MSPSCELTEWPDWTFCPVVLQLAWLFSSSACFTCVHHLATCKPQDPVASPKILSRSSLHFVGIRGICTSVCLECKELVFPKQSGLATWLSRESKPRANWMASLDFLSYSATAGMMVQLLCMLHLCASSGSLQAASHPLEHFFTLSHTLPLHDSHLNTGFLSAELQENWHEIKPTRWLIKFNLA